MNDVAEKKYEENVIKISSNLRWNMNGNCKTNGGM